MFSKDYKFEISNEEYDQIKKWYDMHECTLKERHGMPKYVGPIGGGVSITFTPTSIGNIIDVECACGAKFSVRKLV